MVAGSSNGRCGYGFGRAAKVHDFNIDMFVVGGVGGGGKNDIVGFDVSMDNAAGVNEIESMENLSNDGFGARNGKSSVEIVHNVI